MSVPNTIDANRTTLMELTAEIVAAFVSRNPIPAIELPSLISQIFASVSGLGQPQVEAAAPKLIPAVPIKKSVTDDYLISLEDGRKLKSMKRYLAGLGMTPAEYRAKWNLPNDYPTVAPGYALKRSQLAKSIGLGRKAVQRTEPAAVSEAPKRGRKKAA